MTTTLGKYKYRSKVEFGLTSRLYFGRNNALAFGFVEVSLIDCNSLLKITIS